MDEDEIVLETPLGQSQASSVIKAKLAAFQVHFSPAPNPLPSLGSLDLGEDEPVADAASVTGSSSFSSSQATGSSYHGSLFDHDRRTLSSVTDPSDHADEGELQPLGEAAIQQAALEDRPLIYNIDNLELPCELCMCNKKFRFDETEAWYRHLINDHLNGNFPSRWSCLFCDEEFIPIERHRFGGTMDAFKRRMVHIKGHYHGEMAREQNIRPDPHVFSVLVKLGMLSPDQYRRQYRLIAVMRPEEALPRNTGPVNPSVGSSARRYSGLDEVVTAGRNRRRDARGVHR